MSAHGTVTLYQFPRGFGLPNPSPFCVKVETWLRMAGIQYENAWVTNPARMPKGKCPAIAHEGHAIGDSTFILEYLQERFAPGLDDALGTEALAAAHAFARMLEERSYWVLVYSRWVDQAGWASTREMFFASLPPGVRTLVAAIARRRIRSQIRGHGIGRHAPAEIYALGAADLAAVSGWLGDKPFFMGDTPTGVDATVYGFVANVLRCRDTPLADAARLRTNLAPYCERMRARFFPEVASGS
jgi:glutathione S-transferase